MAHRLLLADDSVTIQRVIELTFADEDISVIAVGDGQQAIEHIQAEPPDIVLADIDMPERDGFEVANFVKQNPALKHIPVILLTGAFDPVDEGRVAAAGCDGILAKPFEPQLLITRVKDLLADAAKSGASDAAALPQAAGPSVARPADAAANSLDDYFEQLDAAFSALGVNATSTAKPAPEPEWSPEPPAATGLAEPDWPAPEESNQNLPPAAQAAGREPDAALATAFSALLSAEQGEPAPAGTLRRGPQPALPFDAIVEEATRRVIHTVGTQAVRDQVAAIVADIAERLVREEIEKLKASIS